MNKTDKVADALVRYFGTQMKSESVTIRRMNDPMEYQAVNYILYCNRATRNHVKKPYIKNAYFMFRIFEGLFVPKGFNSEEFFIAAPLPFSDNNSYDSAFTNWVYSSLEPELKAAFPDRPVFCENHESDVVFGIMLTATGAAVSDACIESLLNALNEVAEYIKEKY